MSTPQIQTLQDAWIETFEDTPGSPIGISRRTFVRGALAGLGLVTMPTLLSACSGKAPSSTPTIKGLEGVAKTTAGPPTPGVLYPPKYVGPHASVKKPFADGSKTFKIVVPQSQQTAGDWNKNKFSQWLEQHTGIKVQYQTVVTTDNDMTKVNAMVAAGDLPDAFMGIPFTRDQISLYGGQGVFVALDAYIETYGVELKQAESDFPNLRKLGLAADGKTYAYPQMSDCYHCTAGAGRTFVSKTLMAAVGSKLPETTDDFRTMLKAFKDKNANGHGNTVPFVAGVNSAVDSFFMNAFLFNPGKPWLRLDSGKVDFVANKPEWREGLKFMRSLSDDGTLTSDAFTLTDEAVLKLGNNPGFPRIGVARAFHWGVFADIVDKPGARWKDYVALPALKGPSGVRYANWDHYFFYTPGLVITKKCSDPALLAQWADYQIELEAWMNAYAGVKGQTWDWATKGTVGMTGTQATYAITQQPPPVGTSWSGFGQKYASNDWRTAQVSDPKNPNYESALYEATKTAYAPYQEPIDFQLPPLVFGESDAAQIADTSTSIEQHVTTNLAAFALGKTDVNDDSAWKKYTDALDKMGLPAYLDTYQNAYESYKKNG